MLDPSSPQRPIATASRKLAIFVAFATVTALLLGMLGRFLWPFDLLVHFRVHYIVALACSGVLLMQVREWRSGLFALLAAILVAVPTFEYLQPAVTPRGNPDASLKALSVNIWFRNEDSTRLIEYLEASGVDLVVLQEISEQRARTLAPRLKSFPFAYIEGADVTDTVLFSRWPIRERSVVKLAAEGTSALNAVVDWRGTSITVMGVHLHWPIGPRSSARRNSELTGIAALAQAERGPLLLLGDFNVTPWSTHFTRMLEAAYLHDCAIGHGLQPTWPSHIRWLGIRIDHCVASAHWRTVDVWTGPHIGSDHRPMGVELKLK